MTTSFLGELPCQPAFAVDAESPLAEAEELVLQHGATEIYVTGEQRTLIGVVTDYELLKWRILANPRQVLVKQLMTPVSLWLTSNTTLAEAAVWLRQNICRSLPIIDHGQLLGQIDRRNLLSALRQRQEAPAADSTASASQTPRLPIEGGPKFLQFAESERSESPTGISW